MLKGVAISPGYALGKAYFLKTLDFDEIPRVDIGERELPDHQTRFVDALAKTKAEISGLLATAQVRSGLEIANIFNAHLILTDDPDLHKEIKKRLERKRINIEAVVLEVIREYSDFFRSLPDTQFQEKAVDILDVGKRILKNLQRQQTTHPLSDLTEKVVLMADDITPSDVVSLDTQKILGIVTAEGTATSHAAILARSLGIPALAQVKNLTQHVAHGAFVIVDGNTGTLVCNPSAKIIDEYYQSLADFQSQQRRLFDELSMPSQTADGVAVKLQANIGQTQDVDAVLVNQAHGIGLYRTEFTYLIRRRFPTEEELFDLYSTVVNRLAGATVVIRTIDLGGDKISHLLDNPGEKNPEMGWRAVRLALDRTDVFHTQIRAIVRAAGQAAPGQVKMLLPMISNLHEVRRAKAMVEQIRSELCAEGKPVHDHLPIGVMIEVPSAALLADRLAREVEFFSIGSNDLIQYTLAVDRTNARVAHLYQPLNPAVLGLIRRVVQVGDAAGIPVSLCGELAGDARYTILLLGLGLRELSMNAVFIPHIKKLVRAVRLDEARAMILPLLELDTAEEIETRLEVINRNVCGEEFAPPARQATA